MRYYFTSYLDGENLAAFWIHENSTYKQIAFFKLQIAIKSHSLCRIILSEKVFWCFRTLRFLSSSGWCVYMRFSFAEASSIL